MFTHTKLLHFLSIECLFLLEHYSRANKQLSRGEKFVIKSTERILLNLIMIMRNLTTDNIEFISVNEIYRIASEEMEKADSSHGIATRAIAEAQGDKEIAKNLFIKFQYEELSRKEVRERAERNRKKREHKRRGLLDKQWQYQMDIERKEIEQAAERRQLKWQRKFEVERSERKVDEISRWGVGIIIIFGLVWFFDYKDKLSANDIGIQSSSYAAAPVNIDESAKVTQYFKAAEQGDIKAQVDLGMAYEKGKGITKDETQAALWFRKAAERGNPLAQDILGYLYANGKGVVKDKVQTVIWYRKAAEQGNVNAQFNLAVAYKNGIGLSKDETQAVKWFGKAANQGDAEAQTILGKIYEYGLLGVRQNELQAQEWYQKAAEQGSQEALDALVNLEAWLTD